MVQSDTRSPTTLAAIADAADVSVSTVSRVMAGRRGISRQTVERVRKVASEMGYRPKPGPPPAARRGRAGLHLGLIHIGSARYQPQIAIASYLHQQFLLETWRAAHNAGHLLCIDYLNLDQPGDRSPMFTPDAVDGVIVKGSYDHALIDRLPRHLPTVLLRMPPGTDPRFTCVDCNYTTGIARCVHHLHHLGHRRIAFFSLEASWQNDLDKILSYQRTLAMLGLDNASYLFTAPNKQFPDSTSACAHAVKTWLGHPRPPSAIISGEAYCYDIAQYLTAAGKRVPQDVSLIDAVTGASPHQDLREHATRLQMPAQPMCRVAVDHLLRHIHQPDTPPQTVLMEMDFFEGNTTAPPPPDAA